MGLAGIAGVIADQFDKLKLLRYLYLFGSVITFFIIINQNIIFLYFSIFILATVKVFSDTIRNPVMGELVDEKEYIRIQSVYSTINATSVIIGPAMGSVIYYSLGIKYAFLLITLVYILSSGVMFGVRVKKSIFSKYNR